MYDMSGYARKREKEENGNGGITFYSQRETEREKERTCIYICKLGAELAKGNMTVRFHLMMAILERWKVSCSNLSVPHI
jgi:hypothetical protein